MIRVGVWLGPLGSDPLLYALKPPAAGNSRCKGPGAGLSWVWLRGSRMGKGHVKAQRRPGVLHMRPHFCPLEQVSSFTPASLQKGTDWVAVF